MAASHISGPLDSKLGYKVNANPLIGVAGNTASNKRILCGSVSVADGGSINTGLTAIDAFHLAATGAGHIVTGTVSGGTITVRLYNHDGTTVTTAETVYWIAVGN